MVQNVWYSNSRVSHVNLTFEYKTPTLSGVQGFNIQMVTLLAELNIFTPHFNPM